MDKQQTTKKQTQKNENFLAIHLPGYRIGGLSFYDGDDWLLFLSGIQPASVWWC